MTTLLIRDGRLIDPSQKLDRKADLLLRDGKVAAVGSIPAGTKADDVIDANGLVVCPGLIDMHVHFRQPGLESEETIASGAAAAAAGGFTTVCAMPNTDPACDSEAQCAWTIDAGRRTGLAHVLPIGCVSKGRKGEALAELANMARGGAVAFSDDGAPVANTALMRLALEYSKMLGKPVIQHAEDPHLFGSGCMHEGRVSMELGLEGIPAAAEESMVARDCILAELTGGHLHVAHISTRGTAEHVRRAKKSGLRVTCEVTPHHFTLTDESVRSYDPVFKMNPPLRTDADIRAMLAGLKDGTIDAIASDHAPHAPEEKELEFPEAPFGVIGLETTLGIVMTYLVDKGHLSLPQAIAKMTIGPAGVLGLKGKGTLKKGADADVTIFDPNAEWKVESRALRSRSRNCPFHDWKLKGRIEQVVLAGQPVNDKSEI